MKTRHLLILFAAFFAGACHKEESIQQSQVQFSFAPSGSDDSGGRKQTDNIRAGSFLRITIMKNNNEAVFSSKKFEIIKLGELFITNPIALSLKLMFEV